MRYHVKQFTVNFWLKKNTKKQNNLTLMVARKTWLDELWEQFQVHIMLMVVKEGYLMLEGKKYFYPLEMLAVLKYWLLVFNTTFINIISIVVGGFIIGRNFSTQRKPHFSAASNWWSQSNKVCRIYFSSGNPQHHVPLYGW